MRTANELRIIRSALWHTKETLEQVDAHGCCVNGFATPELSEMFYALNSMSIKLSDMIDELEASAPAEESKEVAP